MEDFIIQKGTLIKRVLVQIGMDPFFFGHEIAKLSNLMPSPLIAHLNEALVVIVVTIEDVQVERVVRHESKFATR